MPGAARPAIDLVGSVTPAVVRAPRVGHPTGAVVGGGVPGLFRTVWANDQVWPQPILSQFVVGMLTVAEARPRIIVTPIPPIPPAPLNAIRVKKTGPRAWGLRLRFTDIYLIRYTDVAGLRIDFDRSAVISPNSIYLMAGDYDVTAVLNPNTGRDWFVYLALRSTPFTEI
jgi:hypothetical protein